MFCGAAALVWNPGFADAAGEMGLTVLAVESPTAHFADMPSLASLPFLWADPALASQVVAGLRAWASQYRIRGVCALREDWVETAALIADWLVTPTIGLRAAKVCRDKSLQRSYLAAWSPRSSTSLDTWDAFPAVVKPLDGSAGVGVRSIRDRHELSAIRAREGGLLIEERVTGPEFSVESLVQHGEVVFAGVTAKRTNEDTGNAFVELAHTVPALLPDADRHSLLEANSAVVDRLAVGDGILHAEYRLDAAGQPVLMEVNARCPGGSIPALYHLATGARLEHAIVALAVGEPVSYPAPVRTARQVYVTHESGVLRDVTTPALTPTWLAAGEARPPIVPCRPDAPPRLHAVLVIKPKGAPLRELEDNRDRAVTFVIDAASPDELNVFESQVSASLEVLV